jgi:hypothetical protein
MSVKRDLLQCQKRPCYNVKRDNNLEICVPRHSACGVCMRWEMRCVFTSHKSPNTEQKRPNRGQNIPAKDLQCMYEIGDEMCMHKPQCGVCVRSQGSGWRIHCGVEVTELSANKQHTLSLGHGDAFVTVAVHAVYV